MRAFGEANDTATDAFAVPVASILVGFTEDDHSTADNALRAAELNKRVSDLVMLGIAFVVGLDLLDVSNTSVVDVLPSESCLGIEGVVNIAGGLTAMVQIAKLRNFDGVQAGGEASELSND